MGGMAHVSKPDYYKRFIITLINAFFTSQGPCGEEFRAAFSCFVFSEQEPKGIDCVEK